MRKRSGELLLTRDVRGHAGTWNYAPRLRETNTEDSPQLVRAARSSMRPWEPAMNSCKVRARTRSDRQAFKREQVRRSPARIVELLHFCRGECAIVDADVVEQSVEVFSGP